MGGVSGARWQTDDQLHLTLRFIGDVERRLAEDVAAALDAIRHPPFQLALDGLGTFASRGQVDTMWAGVTPHDQLNALHKKIDQACMRAGLEPERRAYAPHITLARLKRGSGSLQGFMLGAGGFSVEPFDVGSFALFESHLGSEGASYSVVTRYALG